MFTNNEIFLLYQYQEGYRELISIQEQSADSAFTLKIKSLSNNLALLIRKINILKDKIDQLRTKIKKLEDECHEFEYQVSQTEENLYSGRISSPKELSQLQKKSAEYKNSKESREEKIINLLYLVEEDENKLVVYRKQMKKLKQDLESFKRKEKTRIAELRSKADEIQNKVNELDESLPEGLKEFFKRSVKVMKGIVVAPVKEGTCGSCHIILSQALLETIKKGDTGSIPICENCGRGLFFPPPKISK